MYDSFSPENPLTEEVWAEAAGRENWKMAILREIVNSQKVSVFIHERGRNNLCHICRDGVWDFELIFKFNIFFDRKLRFIFFLLKT